MQPVPQAATIAVAVLGLTTLFVARMPAFRQDFRRSISLSVGAVSLLTILLSLNVLLVGLALRDRASIDDLAMINGLLLAGFVLLLVSTLAFFFSLGTLIWTLVPTDPEHHPGRVASGSAATRPVDPYTP
jgi:hypothetical protein